MKCLDIIKIYYQIGINYKGIAYKYFLKHGYIRTHNPILSNL
jgi:hypothetical protein